MFLAKNAARFCGSHSGFPRLTVGRFLWIAVLPGLEFQILLVKKSRHGYQQ
jgi:hypothetical protein